MWTRRGFLHYRILGAGYWLVCSSLDSSPTLIFYPGESVMGTGGWGIVPDNGLEVPCPQRPCRLTVLVAAFPYLLRALGYRHYGGRATNGWLVGRGEMLKGCRGRALGICRSLKGWPWCMRGTLEWGLGDYCWKKLLVLALLALPYVEVRLPT